MVRQDEGERARDKLGNVGAFPLAQRLGTRCLRCPVGLIERFLTDAQYLNVPQSYRGRSSSGAASGSTATSSFRLRRASS